jgi:hypothetical protein
MTKVVISNPGIPGEKSVTTIRFLLLRRRNDRGLLT